MRPRGHELVSESNENVEISYFVILGSDERLLKKCHQCVLLNPIRTEVTSKGSCLRVDWVNFTLWFACPDAVMVCQKLCSMVPVIVLLRNGDFSMSSA